MHSSALRRRVTYVGLASGLLAAGLVPLAASAATAACPTYVDAPRDSAPVNPALSVLLQDGQLDILSVTHSTRDGVLSSTVALTALNESGSLFSVGDWYEVTFTVAEKVVAMRVVRDTRAAKTTTTRLQVGGVTTDVKPEAVYDFKNRTVTISVKTAELEKAVGAQLAGKPFSAMSTRSFENYSAAGLTWDTATAGEDAKYVFGTACKADAAPAAAPAAPAGASPAPGASPTAGSSPTANPSPRASAAPSGSAAPRASASAGASPSATPSPQPTVPVPAAGCFGFQDPKGDARPSGQLPNDPALDILSVTGRTTDETLSGHLRIDRLAGRPALPVFTGLRFEYQFTVGGKVVLLRADQQGDGTGLVNGTAAPDLKVTAAFDVVSSQVVLSVTRESLAKVLGREVPEGTFLDSQIGRSFARPPAAVVSPADTASTDDAARARYTVGDNTCFAPKLSVSLPGQVQTSDVALISVAMTTSDGRTAAGQDVTARVGKGRAVAATTDAQGTANLLVPVSDAAGTRLLVVRSAGSAGRGELSTPLDVAVESTLLTVRSAGGSVTATLTDDDDPRRALANQQLTFTFAGRTVPAVTDRAGRAVVEVPPGTQVEVAFPGRSGFLSAARARVTARR